MGLRFLKLVQELHSGIIVICLLYPITLSVGLYANTPMRICISFRSGLPESCHKAKVGFLFSVYPGLVGLKKVSVESK